MTTFDDEERTTDQPSAAGNEGKPAGALNRGAGRIILALQSVYDKLLAGRLRQLQSQVIAQDREISQLARELAQMRAQIRQMNGRLSTLEDEAAGETAPTTGDDSE
ncbi:MAG: hypothetical protein PVH65_06685 [Chloroflexota bacterium]|jgi:uncharacterized coiled-coil protein SlyX